MKNSTVRLSAISISNLKNVKYGEINFQNRRKNYKSSVLGLYGQNGSGKTVLIDAVQILKYLLCGKKLPSEMAEFINVEEKEAKLSYSFEIRDTEGQYEAFYDVYLRKEDQVIEQNLEVEKDTGLKARLQVYKELLSYSFENKTEKIRKSPLIDTQTEKVFVPAAKYECLIGKEKEMMMNLLVTKKIAERDSRSFVFSRELLNAARLQKQEKEKNQEFQRHLHLLENLIYYGNYELFVIHTANSGMISMNALPLAFKYEEKGRGTVGQMTIPLEQPDVIPSEALVIVEKVIEDMNIVLEQIIPGLTISVKNLGTELMEKGGMGNRIQLMSHKNNKEIPLKHESEGIKKIISILQLLIAIYNQSSITVAVDELDSGIFEYLLGEILRIVSEKGKGQLIFTSHNLRPLETIDRGFIAFTTTNPARRYVRMTNIKDNNNVRDFYFRDIVLGEQKEELYEETNNAEIALAFREAGEIRGA